MRFISALLVLVALLSAPAQAQAPQQFYVFADTAGVSQVAGNPGMYITWVFAKASPNAYPSSGVLVMWDCLHSPQLVKRIAQVVYHMTADSTGVTGDIEEVLRDWQPVTDERLAAMVCRVGSQHDGTYNQPWFAPGKPRSDS
jgi:hypothetical protein